MSPSERSIRASRAFGIDPTDPFGPVPFGLLSHLRFEDGVGAGKGLTTEPEDMGQELSGFFEAHHRPRFISGHDQILRG